MKHFILILTFFVLFGAGVITAVPARAQENAPSRLVIKNGELQVLATDTDAAIETALNLVKGFNGYVLNQQVWEDNGRYRYATLTVGVPAAGSVLLISAKLAPAVFGRSGAALMEEAVRSGGTSRDSVVRLFL